MTSDKPIPVPETNPDPWHYIEARRIFHTIFAYGWDVTWRPERKQVPDDAWPIDIIAKALLAAREKGREDVRRFVADPFPGNAAPWPKLPMRESQ